MIRLKAEGSVNVVDEEEMREIVSRCDAYVVMGWGPIQLSRPDCHMSGQESDAVTFRKNLGS